jgi:PKD repeat protein
MKSVVIMILFLSTIVNATRFKDMGDGVIVDFDNKLMWEKSGSTKNTYDGVFSDCSNLNLGGFDDWVIPSLANYESLVRLDLLPTIEPNFDINLSSDTVYFWTSTVSPDFGRKYSIVFKTSNPAGAGNTYKHSSTMHKYVRCVRSAPNILNTKNYDIVISDESYNDYYAPSMVLFSQGINGANIESYNWDFGDGSFSTEAFPEHNYKVAGDYIVKLKVLYDDNMYSTVTKTIKIKTDYREYEDIIEDELVRGDFETFEEYKNRVSNWSKYINTNIVYENYNPDTKVVYLGYNLNKYKVATTKFSSYLSIDDAINYYSKGETSNVLTYLRASIENDNIILHLVGFDLGNGKVLGNEAPILNSSYLQTYGKGTKVIDFILDGSDNDGYIEQITWDFGDGYTSSEEDPQHIYAEFGSYDVSVTVVDNLGEKVTKLLSVNVLDNDKSAPELKVSHSSLNGTSPLEVKITLSATDSDGSISSYECDLGDGIVVNSKDITHIYTVQKDYNVVCKVIDDDGLSDEISLLISVSECSNIDVYVQNPQTKNWYILHNSCDIPLGWGFSLDKPSSYDVSLNKNFLIGQESILNNLSDYNLITTEYLNEIVDKLTQSLEEQVIKIKDLCKNSPKECGIVIPSTDGLYTEADLETKVETTKTLCQNNPEACGVSTTTTTPMGLVDKNYIDGLGSGWHNLGDSLAIGDMGIFDSANIVWSYDTTTTSWKAYSSDIAIETIINSTSAIQSLDNIPANQGFWVLK